MEQDRDQSGSGVSLGKAGSGGPANAPVGERWWRRPGFVVFCLVVMPPVGIVLAWWTRWSPGRKVLATVLSGVWFVAVGTSDPPADEPAVAGAKPSAGTRPTAFTPYTRPTPTPTPTVRRVVADYRGQNLEAASRAAYEAGFRARSHDATEDDKMQLVDGNWKVCFQEPAAGETATTEKGRRIRIEFAVVEKSSPCPARDGEAVVFPKVPNVVGKTFAKGSAELREVGLTEIRGASVYTDVELSARHEDWRICFQSPEAGEDVERPAHMSVRLSLARPGLSCPSEDYARLYGDPDPDPDRHGGTDGGSGGSDGSGDSGGSGGGLAYYKNCDAVRAAGKAPIYRGQPGYRSGLDRDNDGKACDWS
ncbi:excalibur calcium-binding domain-containing protein [Streptomyces sp. SJL17-1]|uniref:excalibur calcium-binding domain-containing protein n=1 Tax=Streptomyces sp. SJL17-1 TaxID=2967223 RepID=UPI0029670212|nr:excalibur calcium-binding domain-containing protein [Streptomyces sp. SJL17-1]